MLRGHLATEHSCRPLKWQAVKGICLRTGILTTTREELLPEVRAERTGPLRLGSSKNLPVLQNTRERFTNDHSSVQETPNHLLLHWRRAPIHTPCDEILPGNETGHSGTCLGEEPAKRWSAPPELLAPGSLRGPLSPNSHHLSSTSGQTGSFHQKGSSAAK